MDRICRKTLFLGYPICDQPTSQGKRSATPTLFPSPGGHVPYIGDFCWGIMYRFPAIHVRTSSFATVSATAKFGCLYFFSQNTRRGGATIGSPICTGTLLQCTFSSLFFEHDQHASIECMIWWHIVAAAWRWLRLNWSHVGSLRLRGASLAADC